MVTKNPASNLIIPHAFRKFYKEQGDPLTGLLCAVLNDAIEGIRAGQQAPIIWLISEPLAQAACEYLNIRPVDLLKKVYLEQYH